MNGPFFLNSSTVHDDVIADSLTGGLGSNWFFGRLSSAVKHSAKDKTAGESADEI